MQFGKSKEKKKRDGSVRLQTLPSMTSNPREVPNSNAETPTATSHLPSTRTSSDSRNASTLAAHEMQLANALSPAVLSTNLVRSEGSSLNDKAKQLQDASSLWMRFKWQDHDRVMFLSRLDSLRDYIEDLDGLVKLRTPKDASLLLGSTTAWPQRDQDEQIQSALKRLHDALASINPRASVVTLGVQIQEDPERQADMFSSESSSLSFAPGSLMFVLQAHLPGDSNQSLFLYTESLGPASTHGRHTEDLGRNPLTDIGSVISSLQENDDSGEYRVLGFVNRSRSADDCHHLYSPATGPWISPSTLAQYLERGEYKNDLSKQQRFRIARLLVISFIHFTKVARATEQYPRPSRVQYYLRDGSTDKWLNESGEPNIFNPFVTLGFGMPKPSRLPGTYSGLLPQAINPVVELGLVLYQIGSGSNLDYGTGDIGVKAAVDVALRHMRKVDEVSNGSFSEVIQVCLGWRNDAHAPIEHRDFVQIDRVRQWLRGQEQRPLL